MFHGPVQGVIQAAGDDDADLVKATVDHIIELVFLVCISLLRASVVRFFPPHADNYNGGRTMIRSMSRTGCIQGIGGR